MSSCTLTSEQAKQIIQTLQEKFPGEQWPTEDREGKSIVKPRETGSGESEADLTDEQIRAIDRLDAIPPRLKTVVAYQFSLVDISIMDTRMMHNLKLYKSFSAELANEIIKAEKANQQKALLAIPTTIAIISTVVEAYSPSKLCTFGKTTSGYRAKVAALSALKAVLEGSYITQSGLRGAVRVWANTLNEHSKSGKTHGQALVVSRVFGGSGASKIADIIRSELLLEIAEQH